MVKFVIVGSGVVGTSTCYQLLRKFPSAQVTLIDSHMRPAEGASRQNGGNLPVHQARCWTWKSPKAVLKGLYTFDTNSVIYPW